MSYAMAAMLLHALEDMRKAKPRRWREDRWIAANLRRRHTTHLTEDSLSLLRYAIRQNTLWVAHANRALRTYGDHGPLISGSIRYHFPEDVKDHLRHLAHTSSAASTWSYRLWVASGRRGVTWRKLRDRLTPEG